MDKGPVETWVGALLVTLLIANVLLVVALFASGCYVREWDAALDGLITRPDLARPDLARPDLARCQDFGFGPDPDLQPAPEDDL